MTVVRRALVSVLVAVALGLAVGADRRHAHPVFAYAAQGEPERRIDQAACA